MSFQLDRRREAGVTTDVSLSGAFVNAAVSPASGTRLVLDARPVADEASVHLHGVVARAVNPRLQRSVAPGFGFQFEAVSTAGSVDHLRAVLRELLGTEVRVKPRHAGGAVWIAPGWKAERTDSEAAHRVRADANRLQVAAMGAGASALPGFEPGATVDCHARRQRYSATVTDVGTRSFGLSVEGEPPGIGVIVLVHFGLPGGSRLEARLVGVVVDRAPRGRFTAQVLRTDLEMAPGSGAVDASWTGRVHGRAVLA